MVQQQQFSRRKVLRTGAATAGLLATGSLAGCGGIPFLGGGSGAYVSWIPDPDEYDSEGMFFSNINYSAIAENEDNFDEDLFESIENGADSTFDPLDIDYEDVTSASNANPFSLYDGDYENSTVIEALEDDETGQGEFEEDDTYEDYRIFILDEAADEPQIAYSVNGTQVLRTGPAGDNNAVEMAELLIDTNAGESPKLVDENEKFKALTDEVGGGTTVTGSLRTEEIEDGNEEQGQFEGVIASGQQFSINGETTDGKWVYVYDSEGDGDEGDLEDYAEEALDDQYDFNSDPSFSVSGDVGTITGTFDTDDLSF
jgi:hypothetical protein